MAPRSRTGCLTCRQRKLKCSEERPECAQCIKANRQCVPSSGITFRHQQNPSLNGAGTSDGSGLNSFYGYKETFGKGVQWVDIPRELTFVHTNNPFQEQPFRNDNGDVVPVTYLAPSRNLAASTSTADLAAFANDATGLDASDLARDYSFALNHASYPAYATHGLEALSAVASQDPYNQGFGQSSPPPTSGHDMIASSLDGQNHHENKLDDSALFVEDSASAQQQLRQQEAAAQALSSPNLGFMLNQQHANYALAASAEMAESELMGENSNIDPQLQAALMMPANVSPADHMSGNPSVNTTSDSGFTKLDPDT